MNIAAIDIGSNAARLLIKRFEADETGAARVRKLLFIRIPLRLGKDVFTLGKVSKERQRMMLHMMKGFRQFMLLYEVEHFRACATSAMRDAENGRKLMLRLEKETGIALEIIPGAEEAQLLIKAPQKKSTVQFKDSVKKSVFSSEKVVNRHFKNIGKCNKLNICHETNLTFKL